MASIKLIDTPPFRPRIKDSSFPLAIIKNKNGSRLRIQEQLPFRTRFTSIGPFAIIKNKNRSEVKIQEQLPFRVRFTSIGIPGYGPSGFPGIGIQIIGFNNYIL